MMEQPFTPLPMADQQFKPMASESQGEVLQNKYPADQSDDADLFDKIQLDHPREVDQEESPKHKHAKKQKKKAGFLHQFMAAQKLPTAHKNINRHKKIRRVQKRDNSASDNSEAELKQEDAGRKVFKKIRKLSPEWSDPEQNMQQKQSSRPPEPQNNGEAQLQKSDRKARRRKPVYNEEDPDDHDFTSQASEDSADQDFKKKGGSGKKAKQSKQDRLKRQQELVKKKQAEKYEKLRQKYGDDEGEESSGSVPGQTGDAPKYYTGMEFQKKKSEGRRSANQNVVKSKNKLFGQFQLAPTASQALPDDDQRKQQLTKEMPKLDIPVSEVKKERFSFLDRFHSLKRTRGLSQTEAAQPSVAAPVMATTGPAIPETVEAAPNVIQNLPDESKMFKSTTSQTVQPQIGKISQLKRTSSINMFQIGDETTLERRAKFSLAKLIQKEYVEDENEELEIQVGLPTFSRGRDSSIFNSTMYLKMMMSKTSSSEQPQPEPATTEPVQPKPSAVATPAIRKPLSRTQLFSQLLQTSKVRKSKFLTQEEIKQSFKQTSLEELEQVKKRLEQQRQNALKAVNGKVDEDEGDEDYQPDQQSQSEKQIEQPKAAQRTQQEELKYRKLLALEDEEIEVEVAKQAQQKSQNQDENIEEQNVQAPNNQMEIQQGQEQAGAQNVGNSSQDEEEQEEQPQNDSDQRFIQDGQEQSDSSVSGQGQSDQLDGEAEPQGPNEELEEYNRVLHPQDDEGEGISRPKRRNQISVDQDSEPEEKGEQQHTINTPRHEMSEEQSRLMFRKLKNLAAKMKERKEREMRKRLGQQEAEKFFDEEAELGSDNQENDGKKKDINEEDEDEYDGEDLDVDLQELIDYADINYDEEGEEAAYQKFLRDERLKDKEELLRVIQGNFRQRKTQDELMFVDEEQRMRAQRIKEMAEKRRLQEEDEEQLYYREQLQQNQERLQDEDSLQLDPEMVKYMKEQLLKAQNNKDRKKQGHNSHKAQLDDIFKFEAADLNMGMEVTKAKINPKANTLLAHKQSAVSANSNSQSKKYQSSHTSSLFKKTTTTKAGNKLVIFAGSKKNQTKPNQ